MGRPRKHCPGCAADHNREQAKRNMSALRRRRGCMPRRCQRCGGEVFGNARYCSGCHKVAPAFARERRAAAWQAQRQPCRCGAALPKNAHYCEDCRRANRRLQDRAYYQRHPEYRRETTSRVLRKQAAALKDVATRYGRYSPAEDVIVMSTDLSSTEKAILLRRTLWSVKSRIAYLRR